MDGNSWLAEIYSEERKRLFLTAWNILRHAESAEDAVHAAFVKMAKLPRPPKDARLYAFKAVRNAAIDVARVNSRRPKHETLEAALFAETTAPTPDDYLETALDRLRPDVREIVELHIHSRLSFREIAELLGRPLQTVATRYRRALHTIRTAIEVEQNE